MKLGVWRGPFAALLNDILPTILRSNRFSVEDLSFSSSHLTPLVPEPQRSPAWITGNKPG